MGGAGGQQRGSGVWPQEVAVGGTCLVKPGRTATSSSIMTSQETLRSTCQRSALMRERWSAVGPSESESNNIVSTKRICCSLNAFQKWA